MTNSTFHGDFSVTLPNPSVYKTVGRESYLERVLRNSDSRLERRRAGAGLNDEQVARIRHLRPQVPYELRTLKQGDFKILTGPLGTGKSDIAEQWLRDSAEAAQRSPAAAIPLWLAIDDLDISLDRFVQGEVGLHTLEACGVDIVIDGLDQRSDRAETAVRSADALTDRWPKSRVILTSRATHNSGGRVVEARTISKSYGRKLVELVSGSKQLGRLGPEVEEALARPLFALLIGQQASLGELTTMTEVVDGVVRSVVDREGKDLYPYLLQLAIRTTATARPVDPESFVGFDVASQMRSSPFLTRSAQGLTFSLATFEQWFASRAVLEGAMSPDDILKDLPTFDRWKYVLAMVLAAGESSGVDRLMDRIARWNPGAIAWIIKETESAEIGRYREDLPATSSVDMAYRLRSALEAMLEGLGPLSAAFKPFSFRGVNSLADLSLGLEYGGGRVETIWLASNDPLGATLPPVIDSWAEASRNRSMVLERAAMPASRNWVWATARNILVGDLSSDLTSLAIAIASEGDGIVRREVQDLRTRAVTDPGDLDNLGRGVYGNIYPLPDVPPDHRGWPGFSLASVAERVRAVVKAGIECYVELCELVAPKFGDTLAHRGMMPLEYYADISYRGPEGSGPYSFGPAEPGIRWLLRPVGSPLPNGERRGTNSVDISVNDKERSAKIMDSRGAFGDAYFQYIASVPGLKPFANSFSVHTGRFDIVDRKPATHIAVGWLWEDLKNLGWVEGTQPPDRTR